MGPCPESLYFSVQLSPWWTIKGGGPGDGQWEVISTVWLCLPQASPGQKCVLLLITLTQAVLVPERLGEVTAGTQAKVA